MRRRVMAAWVGIACVSSTLAMGQAEPSPDQMRRMYNDTLHQLQEAQNRRNELAAENDRLNAKVADLQKQLDAAQAKLGEEQRRSAEFASRTIDLRTQSNLWHEFLAHDSALQRRWDAFVQDAAVADLPASGSDEIGANWPWSAGR